MQADGDSLRVTATNLELGISVIGGAIVKEAGAITVPAKTFVDRLAAIPKEAELVLKTDDKTATLTIACKQPKMVANIKGIDANEFPGVPHAATNPGLELEPSLFKEIINRVAFAAATDDARPILMVVHLRVKDKKAVFETADGFRLARLEIEQNVPDMNLCIPARSLSEFARLLDLEQTVTIGTNDNNSQVIMVNGMTTVVSQLVEGAFPELLQVIPKSSKIIVVAPRAELWRALRAGDVFAREAAHTIRMKVIPGEKGHIQIVSVSAETGDDLSEVGATITGPELEIAFNVKYMIDVLGALSCDDVQMDLTNATTPITLKACHDEHDYRYVLMPMHLGK